MKRKFSDLKSTVGALTEVYSKEASVPLTNKMLVTGDSLKVNGSNFNLSPFAIEQMLSFIGINRYSWEEATTKLQNDMFDELFVGRLGDVAPVLVTQDKMGKFFIDRVYVNPSTLFAKLTGENDLIPGDSEVSFEFEGYDLYQSDLITVDTLNIDHFKKKGDIVRAGFSLMSRVGKDMTQYFDVAPFYYTLSCTNGVLSEPKYVYARSKYSFDDTINAVGEAVSYCLGVKERIFEKIKASTAQKVKDPTGLVQRISKAGEVSLGRNRENIENTFTGLGDDPTMWDLQYQITNYPVREEVNLRERRNIESFGGYVVAKTGNICPKCHSVLN